MKLSNWHVAILVFFSTLLGTWLFGPSRVGIVGAAAPTAAASDQPDRRPHLEPAMTLGGVADYIPIWTGTYKILNSIIYQNASGVGIGTTTPSATLEVAGPAKFDGSVTFTGGLSVPVSDLTGVLGTAHGGTGISSAPTADGQYLRASGAGTWSISAIQGTDVPTGKDRFAAGISGITIAYDTSSSLTFGPIPVTQGWTASGGSPPTTLTASDTGLTLGILNVSAVVPQGVGGV